MKEHMYKTAFEWLSSGKRVALATVINTWGSSPRPIGSQLVASEEGAFEGSISGGCVEGEIVSEALDVIGHGKPKRLHFGISKKQANSVGLACGGEIDIFLEKITDGNWISDFNAMEKDGKGVSVITDLETGYKIIKSINYFNFKKSLLEIRTKNELNLNSLKENNENSSKMGRYFVHKIYPSIQVVIIGAVHIAQSLCNMAGLHEFDVKIIDPRIDFITTERFPNATLIEAWPHDGLSKIKLHKRTAVVVLSHDPKFDDPALRYALSSDVFYIGALGSKKTHQARIKRFQKYGFSEKMIKRIHGPVGLPIGAVTPEEIAVSIMAEIIQKRRKEA